MSLSSILDISKRSLMTHRNAINTVSRNIANINTDGYTRRKAQFEELRENHIRFSKLGSGVSSESLSRIRNKFVDNQLNLEYQNNGKFEMDEKIFTQIEDVFGEPYESGLSNVISEFWNAWSDLANEPDKQYTRTIVRDKSISLTQTFNRVSKNLTNLQSEISSELNGKVNEVNQKLNQIKIINKQINVNPSNDLLDQRDIIVSELSKVLDIDARENDNGQLTLSSAGNILVSGDKTNLLTTESKIINGTVKVSIKTIDNNRTLNIQSGEMGSLLQINNTYIPDYINQLDNLAVNMAKQINTIHARGYNLSGITGINFFNSNPTGAGDLQLNENIKEDPSLIAASANLDEAGNGTIAQAIYDIQFRNNLEGNTISEYYNSLIGQVGSKVQESSFLNESQGMVVQSLKNQQDSVSGVSLDEELIQLTQYEQAYQAAAKIINTVDEMSRTVLNLI